jgi:ASC-1-like (ASCH) protein
MIHYMNLRPHPFSMIADGTKTIELRLLDEKRALIEVGDTLVFKNTDDPSKTLACIVKQLHKFANFEQLYRALPLEKCGYLPEELVEARAEDMEEYYSIEKQRLWGVVGIELELK